MNITRIVICLIVCSFTGQLFAQDILPDIPSNDLAFSDSIVYVDTISNPIKLPSGFTGIGNNVVIDDTGSLFTVFEHMFLLKLGLSKDSLRIVHIGDSHIYGHVYPQTTASRLIKTFGPVSYVDMGINGATFFSFALPERIAAIAALKPQLLILSFGTNESHSRSYDKNMHYQQMDKLINMLCQNLPGISILLTTPPGSYDSLRRRRRLTYTVNPRTAYTAKVITAYALGHGLAVWDLYNIAGGSHRACKNWLNSGLMRPDHVHYTPEGYTLQGELLYEAIIKAYNKYVSFKH